MLWRKAYQTKELLGFEPSWQTVRDLDGRPIIAPPQVAIGVCSPRDIPGAELWVRLLESERGDSMDWILIASGLAAEEVLPGIRRSWHSRLRVCAGEAWPTDREFAWRNGLLMIGPPTEDAWDLFLEGLSALED